LQVPQDLENQHSLKWRHRDGDFGFYTGMHGWIGPYVMAVIVYTFK
jgi:hypothetical protein